MKPATIVQVGHPVLRQRARTVAPEELRGREMQDLIALMQKTMYAAPGVGLAAPQIGIGLQIAVIEDKSEYTREAPAEFLAERERRPVPFQVIVNPTIVRSGSETRQFFEGCLSLSGFTGVVERAREITVHCLNAIGEPVTIEASGWYARILQHEIDHLNGIVYIDRMKTRSFMTLASFDKDWKARSMADIQRAIGWE